MPLSYVRDLVLLFVGDLVVFSGSLWLALVARHFVAPNSAEFLEHLLPFAVLFALWLIVFVAVGLYDRHVALFEHTLPQTILEAQIINCGLAVVFFFLAPVAIQPKTILALYFVISTSLIVVWRLGLFRFRIAVGGVERAAVLGTGSDFDELAEAIRRSPHTRLELVDDAHASLLITSPDAVRAPRSSLSRTLDASELYEALLSRVALSMLDPGAFHTAAFSRESRVYDFLKRSMDIVLALAIGILSLFIYPFIMLAIKLDDGGDFFITQERVGKEGRIFRMHKFRTMSGNDQGDYGTDKKTKLTITRVGNVLRKTRIDELPQLWSVLLGHQSLVGPRPELPALVEQYRKEVPHYDLRHLVKPGLSGWAQVYHQEHPHHGTDIEATREKLSYDLYYVKHRSLILDLDITLKTLKTLALRVGA